MTPERPRAPGGPPDGAVVDAHQHFWDISAHAQPWLASHDDHAPLRPNFAPTDLAPLAAAEGVTATVVVQTVAEPWETPELLALAAAGGLVAGVVGWVDLAAPDAADVLAGLRELPGGDRLAAIRHPVLVEPDPDWLARPAVLRGLAAVAAAGLAYDVVGEPRHLPAAAAAAGRLPQLTFVLDHLGNPDVDPAAGPAAGGPWASAFARLAALPNVVAKLSGFLGVPPPPGAGPGTVAHLRPYCDIALAAFGPDRLMFGSDWPVCTLDASYAQVCAAARALTAGLSPAERYAIFSGTARRTYALALVGR
jgi:L-fuconolactonase